MVMVYDNEYTMLLVTLYSSKSRSVWRYVYNATKSHDFPLHQYERRKTLVYSHNKFEIRQPLDVFYKSVLKYTNGQNMP